MIGSFTLLPSIYQTMRSDYPLCMALQSMDPIIPTAYPDVYSESNYV